MRQMVNVVGLVPVSNAPTEKKGIPFLCLSKSNILYVEKVEGAQPRDSYLKVNLNTEFAKEAEKPTKLRKSSAADQIFQKLESEAKEEMTCKFKSTPGSALSEPHFLKHVSCPPFNSESSIDSGNPKFERISARDILSSVEQNQYTGRPAIVSSLMR